MDIAQEKVIFQPEKYDESSKSMHPSGTLDEWKEYVLKFVADQPWGLFAISLAFTGPLLKFAHMDCFGCHIWRTTSQGKTTLGQVSASVWGRGSDPAEDSGSYLCRWNHTANALSAVCAAHNDCLLVLDEFGTCPERDAERFVYDIFGGKERVRLTDKSKIKESRTWRVVALSTGEISVAAKIKKYGTARGGHFVRLLDIPAGELLSGSDPGKLAKTLKRNCTHYYGTAGRAFIRAFIEVCEGRTAKAENLILGSLAKTEARYHALVPPGADATIAAQGRVMDRFALIEVAGLLAHELLDWSDVVSKEAITNAVQTVAKAWLAGSGLLSDAARGMAAVRDFILANKLERFINVKEDEKQAMSDEGRGHQPKPLIRRNLVGHILELSGENCYSFETGAFQEACGGIDQKLVLAALNDGQFLKTNENGKLTYKHSFDDGRRRVYAVRGTLLSDPE
jgi:putative DNA primase/helicase